MDFVTRRHSECRELASRGLMFGRLVCVNRNTDRWVLTCTMDKALLARDEAKQLVEGFIRSQWEGFAITFSIKAGQKDGEFQASFNSHAL